MHVHAVLAIYASKVNKNEIWGWGYYMCLYFLVCGRYLLQLGLARRLSGQRHLPCKHRDLSLPAPTQNGERTDCTRLSSQLHMGAGICAHTRQQQMQKLFCLVLVEGC